MKYCSHCGRELDDEAVICPGCGCPVEGANNGLVAEDTSHKTLYSILSFIFPIVGLVLFLVWKNDRPTVAKACGLCALVSFILSFVVGLVSGFIQGMAGALAALI